MPEVDPDATLIIATSWQALSRAETGDERASICNCTVILVFAAFFLEANLNHVINEIRQADVISDLPGEYAGLQRKLGWFYNTFMASSPITEKARLETALEEEFPGFLQLRDFRNSLAHGVIDRALANLNEAKRLRLAAKRIVDRLLAIAADKGYPVQRGVEYQVAVSSFEIQSPAEGNQS